MSDDLSQDEINDLLGAIDAADAPEEGSPQISIYDYERPQLFTQPAFDAFFTAMEEAATGFSDFVKQETGKDISLSVDSISQQTADEYRRSLPDYCFGLMINMPEAGKAAVITNPLTSSGLSALFMNMPLFNVLGGEYLSCAPRVFNSAAGTFLSNRLSKPADYSDIKTVPEIAFDSAYAVVFLVSINVIFNDQFAGVIHGVFPFATLVNLFPDEFSQYRISVQSLTDSIAASPQDTASGNLINIGSLVGKASITEDSFRLLRSGSLIALDRNLSEPDLIISENNSIMGKGEAVIIDSEYSTFGCRILSLEEEPYEHETDGSNIEAEVLLGETSLKEEELSQIGVGTTLDLAESFIPMKIKFSDGSLAAGFLQCFLNEDLADSASLLNQVPEVDNEKVLVFCVTSETGVANPASISGTEQDADSSDSWPVTKLTSLDYNSLAWVFKASAYEKKSDFISGYCGKLGEEKGASFLDTFILSAPDKAPAYIKTVIEKSVGKTLTTLKEENPVASAADVIRTISDENLKTMLEWLEVWRPETHKELMQYL